MPVFPLVGIMGELCGKKLCSAWDETEGVKKTIFL